MLNKSCVKKNILKRQV